MQYRISFEENIDCINVDRIKSPLFNEEFCSNESEKNSTFAPTAEAPTTNSNSKSCQGHCNYFDGANLFEPASQSSPKMASDFHKKLIAARQGLIETPESFVAAERKLIAEGFHKIAFNNLYINSAGEIRCLACSTDIVVDYQNPTPEEEPTPELPWPCDYPNNASYSRRFYYDEFGRMNYYNAIDLLAMHLRALATPSESKLNKTKHIQMGNGFTSDDLGCIALDLYRSMEHDPFALARKRLYLITFDPKSTDKDNLPNKKYPKYSTYTIKGRNVGHCHFSDTVIEICGALKDFGVIASSKKDICELIAKGSLDKSSTTDSSIASKISSTSRPLHATKQFDTEMIMLLTHTVNAYFCSVGKI